jgi:hypothetical protein
MSFFRIEGCFFHYQQCLLRKCKQHAPDAYWLKNGNGQRVLKMFGALALLPENRVDDAYNFIKQFQKEKRVHQKFLRFNQYFEETWLNGKISYKL